MKDSLPVSEPKRIARALAAQIGGVFVGDPGVIHNLIVGFCAGLHVLIEDVPGVGKTTLALALARSTGLDFGRIQFTPDLLPGDILGMTVWSAERRDFLFKPGAIMHQFILGDEINRASARTQSALLEAMQEEAVTMDGTTYRLPSPFFVIATQNPASFTGTFLLPESQADRFGISFSLGYPAPEAEVTILDRFSEANPLEALAPVTSAQEVDAIREAVGRVRVERSIKEYLVAVARLTRSSAKVKLGLSPRGTRHLFRAAQCEALLDGRDFVIPEDVLRTAPLVLPHRIVLSADAKMEATSAIAVVAELLGKLPLPAGV